MTPEEDRRAGAERQRVQRAEGVEHDREVRAEDVEHDRADRAFVVRKKDLRFRWETRLLYLVAIGLAVYVANLAGQIQGERLRNTVVACQRDSTKNAAIVGFVVDSIAASPTQRHKLLHPEAALRRGPPYSSNAELNAYILRAVKTFPTFSDRECERRAARQVQAG
jgi:hypothetical protein